MLCQNILWSWTWVGSACHLSWRLRKDNVSWDQPGLYSNFKVSLGYRLALSWKQDKNTTQVLLSLSEGSVWAPLMAQGALRTAAAWPKTRSSHPSSLAICWSSSTHQPHFQPPPSCNSHPREQGTQRLMWHLNLEFSPSGIDAMAVKNSCSFPCWKGPFMQGKKRWMLS